MPPRLGLRSLGPDAEALVVGQGVLEAAATEAATRTDSPDLTNGAVLLRVGCGVELNAEVSLAAREFIISGVVQRPYD